MSRIKVKSQSNCGVRADGFPVHATNPSSSLVTHPTRSLSGSQIWSGVGFLPHLLSPSPPTAKSGLVGVPRSSDGYWDGKFVEEQIDDLDEYDGIVQELETRYGEPKRSEPEKVASIQELIQLISQGVSHNSVSAQPGDRIGSALSVTSE